MIYDLIVVGGGASGLMAAISALEKNLKVLILEEQSRVGKKILATGNGRCNFTHEKVSPDDYYTDASDILQSILSRYTVQDVLTYFEKLGMYARNKNGYLYPLSENASTVLDVLRLRIQELHGQVRTDSRVTRIRKKNELFEVLGENFRMQGKAVILAMGSKAGGFCKDPGNMPYELGEAFHIKTSKLYPSLTRMLCREKFFKTLAGVRIQAEVSLYEIPLYDKSSYKRSSYENRKLCMVEKGEVQFTKTGISGIAVFQLSGFAAQSLDKGNEIEVHMNFVKELGITDPGSWILDRMKNQKDRTVDEFFLGILPRKISQQCIRNAGLQEDILVKNLVVDDLLRVYHQMEDFCVHITEVDSMENAQVCRGGFYLDQFDENLQYKKCPGLFACGEILNVDGICGGFNLHFAWISGRTAGLSACSYVEKMNEKGKQ
ncbi:MAG: aminoacetone oxidase family FAD-binding enzyme [Lachnospiraceae bacterium]